MQVNLLKGKIHRAVVTDANLNYTGSITIDKKLLDEAGILPHEKVQVVNLNNGSRIETYVIEGEENSGVICLNGAAARKFEVADIVIIIAYAGLDESEVKDHSPVCVWVDSTNKIIRSERL